MYKVIYKFADLEDDSYVYEVGDTYPRKGLDPTDERIGELSGSENKIGKPLIEKVKQAKKPAETKKKSVPRKADK